MEAFSSWSGLSLSGLSFRDHEAALRRLRICHINYFTPLAWQVQVETTQHLPAVFARGSCGWRPVKICVTPPLKGLSPTFETAAVGWALVFQSLCYRLFAGWLAFGSGSPPSLMLTKTSVD